MSACQQAKAKRRKMRNGYAHLGSGNIPGKPLYKAAAQTDIKRAIELEKQKERRMQKAKG